MPIILMSYMATGQLIDMENLFLVKDILLINGWTSVTAICVMLFSLFHWPCSTTCLTIKKETGSLKWTFISFVLPTFIGMILCFVVNMIATL